ncbi:MAG: hypothetical protein KGO93_06995 [Cyanobacteria bacterium REEB446]|nr:hypothetical protein [Cyanobacteria bacterium REEB446]
MTSKEVLMKERTILDQSDVFKINHNEVHVNSTFPYILDQSLDGFMDGLMKRSTGEFSGVYSKVDNLRCHQDIKDRCSLSYSNHYDQKIIDSFLKKVLLVKENKKTVDALLSLLTEIIQYADLKESRFIERILDIQSLTPSEFDLWDILFTHGIFYVIITDTTFDRSVLRVHRDDENAEIEVPLHANSRKRKRLVISSLRSFRDGLNLCNGIEAYQHKILMDGGIKYFADIELLREIVHELEDAEKLEVLEFSFNKAGTLKVRDLLSGNSPRDMDLKSFENTSVYFAILKNLFKGETLPWCKDLKNLKEKLKEKGLMPQWQTLRQIQKNINLNPQIFDLLFSRENDEIHLRKTKLTLKDLSGLSSGKVKITCSHKNHKGVSLSYDVKKRSFT